MNAAELVDGKSNDQNAGCDFHDKSKHPLRFCDKQRKLTICAFEINHNS